MAEGRSSRPATTRWTKPMWGICGRLCGAEAYDWPADISDDEAPVTIRVNPPFRFCKEIDPNTPKPGKIQTHDSRRCPHQSKLSAVLHNRLNPFSRPRLGGPDRRQLAANFGLGRLFVPASSRRRDRHRRSAQRTPLFRSAARSCSPVYGLATKEMDSRSGKRLRKWLFAWPLAIMTGSEG
jgi:hypothetical protein